MLILVYFYSIFVWDMTDVSVIEEMEVASSPPETAAAGLRWLQTRQSATHQDR